MNTLLEIILSVVGTMLVLALAAQAIQEAIKHIFAIKGWTRFTAIKRLVIEATRIARLGTTDGEDIVAQIVERLRNLSQNGVRHSAVRLDVLDAKQLGDLIESVDPARVCALAPAGDDKGRERLKEVAIEARKWFDLALQPVTERYRRRMQLGALASGLVIVLAVNADAFTLVRQARKDPEFRARMVAVAGASWSADSALRVLQDSAVALAADTATAPQVGSLAPRIQSARARRDSLLSTALRSDSLTFLGYPKGFRPTWPWGFGIVLSTLLVSLGAPFWHDVLETVFGLKNRVRLGTVGGKTAGAANKLEGDVDS
jgi:hypothetical protein